MDTIPIGNWWALALRGLAAVIFGILAFAMPGITLAALVLLFGAYALVDGVFTVIAAVKVARGERYWWALLIEGIVGILSVFLRFHLQGKHLFLEMARHVLSPLSDACRDIDRIGPLLNVPPTPLAVGAAMRAQLERLLPVMETMSGQREARLAAGSALR